MQTKRCSENITTKLPDISKGEGHSCSADSQIYTDFSSENSSRFNSKQLLRRVSSQYDIENENLEERIMAVIDYISGMTDIYALDIYQKINGISLPIV